MNRRRPIPKMKNLFVGNLPFSATEEEIKNLFSQYGSVAGIELITDRNTGLSRGFCFVRMEDPDAEKAVEALNGQLFGGRRMQIKEAFPRVERPPREDRPFRRRYNDRDGGSFDGERRPFRRRYDDRDGGSYDGERRPFRRRYDDRDRGSYDGERRPFRRRYDRRGNDAGPDTRPDRGEEENGEK